MHIVHWSKNQKERRLGRPRYRLVDVKMDLKESGWTGLIWLRAGTSGWLL
jgi:hypothetical protein